jgi:hypothetical protein
MPGAPILNVMPSKKRTVSTRSASGARGRIMVQPEYHPAAPGGPIQELALAVRLSDALHRQLTSVGGVDAPGPRLQTSVETSLSFRTFGSAFILRSRLAAFSGSVTQMIWPGCWLSSM